MVVLIHAQDVNGSFTTPLEIAAAGGVTWKTVAVGIRRYGITIERRLRYHNLPNVSIGQHEIPVPASYSCWPIQEYLWDE